MRPRYGAFVTKETTCPECESVVTWREKRGIRRFRPKAKECPECGELFR